MKQKHSAKRQERKECISTVASKWQTISLRNKKILIRLTAVIMAAALFLTGVTPSFAENNEKIQLKPSAEINWDDAPGVEGTSALIMDARSGEILYEKNAYEKRDPASITKMLTCLVVLETMELDEKVTSTIEFDPASSGTSILMKKGEIFTVEQLLYALMLPSANDAALVLAEASGGTVENFCEMMNERAKRCGAKDTNFTNPNGFNEPIQPKHRTTAYDLALISKEAMKNKEFRKIVSTVDYTIPKTNKSAKRSFINVNRCLSDGESEVPVPDYVEMKGFYRYEGTLGIKTGYTSTAGNCFCGWAKKGDTELIAVVLNSTTYESRFEDAIKLWDYGFSKYYTYMVALSKDTLDEFRVKHGAKGEVAVSVEADLGVTLNKGHDSDGITTEIIPDARKVKAPIKKGDKVGTIIVYKDGEAVKEAPLCAKENVEKGGILSYVGIPDEDVPLFFISVALALILIFVIYNVYRRYQYKQKRRRRAQMNREIRRREWEKERNPFD